MAGIQTNFDTAKTFIQAAFKADLLVNLVGHGGIGKTQLFRLIAEENNMNFVTISANNLKEGELSMPLVSPKDNEIQYVPLDKIRKCQKLYEDYKEYSKRGGIQYSIRDLQNKKLPELKEIYTSITGEEDFVEYYEESHETYVNRVFDKALTKGVQYKRSELFKMTFEELEKIYSELTEGQQLRTKIGKAYFINKILKAVPRPYTLLFVDEIARTDSQVQSELMNFLLERQVNGYRLPDNVKIGLAQNPSSDMPGFQDTDYTSTPMDNAVSSRLTFVHMVPSMDSFIEFGTQYRPNSDEQIIHPVVLEFITEEENIDRLFRPIKTENEDFNDTNPRSWEMISNFIYVLEKDDMFKIQDKSESEKIKQDLLEIATIGKINYGLARSFNKFYIEEQLKMPKPSEVLFTLDKNNNRVPRKKLDKNHIKTIESQSTMRQITFKTSMINYLKNNPDIINEEIIELAMNAVLTLGNTETNATALRMITKLSTSSEDTDQILYEKISDNDLYTDEGYKLYQRMSGVTN